MSPAAGVVLAALLALAAGLLLGWYLGRRRNGTVGTQPPTPPVEVGPVLGALRSSAVLLDRDLTVVEASPSAYSYRLVRAGRLALPQMVSLVQAAQRSSHTQQVEIVIERGREEPPTLLAVRATELPDGHVLVLSEDRTQAQRAEEARRDFVANISHELKTPVGAIGLLAEAIGDAAEDPAAVSRFADRLQQESHRLGKLVQEIIELSRLQFDNPVESARAVRVDAVIAEAIDRTRSSAELKYIRLVRGGPKGLQVIGDKDQLVTAVVNLVDNAIAYSPEHTRVAIGVRDREDAVEITVTDQGIGIPEDQIDRIFERFYRVDPARSRQTGGTGLGLSIVKHIVAAHRGEVKVWSSQGAGSTFTIRLPRHPVSSTPVVPDRPADRADVSVPEGTA
jgi:two-component system sensor histidine kinase SenX3